MNQQMSNLIEVPAKIPRRVSRNRVIATKKRSVVDAFRVNRVLKMTTEDVEQRSGSCVKVLDAFSKRSSQPLNSIYGETRYHQSTAVNSYL